MCPQKNTGWVEHQAFPSVRKVRTWVARATHIPRFGALAVLLLLLILKKPRPKEDLAFRVPKGLSSTEASCPGALGGRVPDVRLSAGALS